ncbi:enoyl-CoA hydratase/isomerase family protein [Microtetraspora malaysiensis]|uniref:enoyl-CoA hydratase/isomerase family protein n=1 Tax=Microtetraspora malaysiensis TaxID=161358 RepID=UPI003D94BD04
MKSIDIEGVDGIAVVTINNPRKLNAWDREMRKVLLEELLRLAEADRDECRAIVITGAGDRAFCAGQDLDEAHGWNGEFADTWVTEIKHVYDAVRLNPKPVVAAVNGVAAGSGFQFALCCDLRVSHPQARLGQPEVRSGLASVTGTWLIEQSVGHSRMKDLVLSARLLSGQEAFEWGLVNRLVPAEDVLSAACRAANEMAALPPESFSLTKQAIADLARAGYEHAFDTAVEYQRKVYETDAPSRVMAEFMARSGR